MSFVKPLIEDLKSKNVEYEVEGYFNLYPEGFEKSPEFVRLMERNYGKEVPPDFMKLNHFCNKVKSQNIPRHSGCFGIRGR